MSIVITATSGNLGRLAVEALLERGTPADQIVAGARNLEKIADLTERGVRTAVIDYDDPATVEAAVSEGDKLVLISGGDLERRNEQHANVIAAASRAGAGHLVYTSGLRAADSPLAIARLHYPTEESVHASGIPFTILRNGWYVENYARDLDSARQRGVLLASVGEGKVAVATRRDLAEAIAAVVTSEGHEGKTYELNGDTDVTYADIAATFTELLGREVIYQAVTPEQHREILAGAGVPEQFVEMMVAVDGGLREGAMAYATDDLSRLIGRPTTPLIDGLRAVAEGA